jgi:DNA repair exonuclease SbcCD ATPase subunit
MNRVIIKTLLLALPLAIVLPASAAPPEDVAPAEGAEPTEAEALEDDILLVIDLPLAADEARDAGVEEAEITEALDAAQAAEVSAGDMAEVLVEEANETRAKGKRAAFGQWVKLQIAEGVTGRELAAKIKERKAELKTMTDEEKAEVDAKIKALGEKRKAHKQKVHELRKKLKDEGKEPTFAGKDRHDALVKAAGERHAKAKADWAKHKGHKKGLDGDKLEDKLDKAEDKLDKAEDKIDEAEDKRDAAEDSGKADKAEDKLDKKEDKLDKKEDKLDKKEDKLDKKDDKHEGHKAPK